MPSKNKLIVAVAGAGKTTEIVKEALRLSEISSKKILLTSYTHKGQLSLERIIKENNQGILNANIDVIGWYPFLLSECVRPYQKDLFLDIDVNGINFDNQYGHINTFKKTNCRRYFDRRSNIFSNETANFIVDCAKKNNSLYVKRLEQVYDYIFIDEVQDLAGSDLDIIEHLLQSKIKVTLVGDSRQATFVTHNSNRYKKYKKSNILEYYRLLEQDNLIDIVYKNECHRSNQDICDFSNQFYPSLPQSISTMYEQTGHDGVFLLSRNDLVSYYNHYFPILLRWNKTSDSNNLPAENMGENKGETFSRVIIIPTKPMLDFLSKGYEKPLDPKYYIAATRPRFSLVIIVENIDIFYKNFIVDSIMIGDKTLKVQKYKLSSIGH